MSAQRTLANTLRRLTQERQLVDFVLRSQSIANDTDAVPAAFGGADHRRSSSPFRGGAVLEPGSSGRDDDMELMGQSLFGDGAGGWSSSGSAPMAQPVPSLSQSFAELNRAATAVPTASQRSPQVTQSPALNRFLTPMLHGMGGAAPAAIRGGAGATFGQSWFPQAASIGVAALSDWQWGSFGRGVLRSMYSEMGVGDVDTRSR